MRITTLGALALLTSVQAGCGNPARDSGNAAAAYPAAQRGDVVETHFGKAIADPYRWLENDPREDPDVAAWTAAQRRIASAHLDALPGRDAFRQSLAAAYDYERIGVPQKEGGRYFYTRKGGQQDQAAIHVRDAATGRARVLVDPAQASGDASAALAEWSASPDGKRVAYAVQIAGSDWRTIKVVDVATGRPLADELKWARFTQIAWAKDGSGFYYSRYPQPERGSADGAGLANHAVYFHRVGTPQARDELFSATPAQPERLNVAGLTSDGRFAVVYSSADLVRATITVVDLESRDRTPRKLIDDPRHRWSVVDNVGTTFYLMTDQGAERSKIVTLELGARDPVVADLLPQQDAIMKSASIAGGRLFVNYLVDAKSEVRRYKLDGTPDGVLALPGIGSASALNGEPNDPEAFFVFASFDTPNTVFRYDVATGRQSVWIEPKVAADLDRIVVNQIFYASKDGTRIPMFVVRREDVRGPTPTLLTGYGAFAISMPPAYSALLTGWLLQGGVLAIPSIRGGGEYGTAWHEAGRRENKQNGFDDFIAAAEYLHAQEIAPVGGITAYGDSAGGLLVGAVVNQRPELFGAALPAVGTMDMLRYDRFTGGRLWVGEYGDPKVEADFDKLLSYSPYHNVRAGRPDSAYPAILAATGEGDNRVVPAHSFKYVAALQAAELGAKPRLLRIDARAGHGAGKPTRQAIDEAADLWAFAAYWTGLAVAR